MCVKFVEIKWKTWKYENFYRFVVLSFVELLLLFTAFIYVVFC